MTLNRPLALLASAALVGLTALSLTGCSAGGNKQGTPQDTVTSFFQDVANKDVKNLAALYTPTDSDGRDVAKGAKYAQYADAKISDWKILNSTENGEVLASYKQDGKSAKIQFKLAQGGEDGKTWFLTDDTYLPSATSGSIDNNYFENGKTYMKVDGKQVTYTPGTTLLPGKYTFVTEDKQGYFKPVTTTVTYGLKEGLSTSPKATSSNLITDKGVKVATAAVLAELKKCADAIYTDKADTITLAEQLKVDSLGAECPSWVNTNSKYDSDGGEGANSMFAKTSQYENLEPWWLDEYEQHPKFQIVSQPTVAVSMTEEGPKYKLSGGSYRLWAWTRHFNGDDIFDAADKDKYSFNWSQAHSFDDAVLMTGGDDSETDTEASLATSPGITLKTDLNR